MLVTLTFYSKQAHSRILRFAFLPFINRDCVRHNKHIGSSSDNSSTKLNVSFSRPDRQVHTENTCKSFEAKRLRLRPVMCNSHIATIDAKRKCLQFQGTLKTLSVHIQSTVTHPQQAIAATVSHATGCIAELAVRSKQFVPMSS